MLPARPPVAVLVQCGMRTVFLGFRGPSGVTPRSAYPPRLRSGCWVAAGTPLHAPVLLRSALRHGGGEKKTGVTPTSYLTPHPRSEAPARRHKGVCRGCPRSDPIAGAQPWRIRGARSHPRRAPDPAPAIGEATPCRTKPKTHPHPPPDRGRRRPPRHPETGEPGHGVMADRKRVADPLGSGGKSDRGGSRGWLASAGWQGNVVRETCGCGRAGRVTPGGSLGCTGSRGPGRCRICRRRVGVMSRWCGGWRRWCSPGARCGWR
ncbi:hypothetical protein SCATT_17570 [Streptantibioticus cattleyicolor NRRL 8057 = DSM 46488]|uniref:Uncharacterized protein n=1 Tax=Streptantibioticus cattleyicolor (strain ATCC 35852 / DSM 46488 / JCM 4925 / NBRC 14057 / NRRL 8057) TaxID=1003195 RepID=G8WQ68_STREN|nr:hypothetical protein SCATT_17570 [Streptantibioticus cattleyicolor NRRL 8057 = DSM 46488]